MHLLHALCAGVFLIFAAFHPLAAQEFPQNAERERHFAPHGEILWDTFGIPHIYGATTEDVIYGYGLAHMENHAETILRKVATGRGRLAEYFGPGAQNANVTSDIQIRTFDIPRRSQNWLAEGTEEQRRYLKMFCDGLNAYASRSTANIDPALAQALPIVPTDILNMIQETIQFGFEPSAWSLDTLTKSWLAGKAVASVPSASKSGSNGWAIGPRKSEAGHTILMGNPHLPWGVNQPVPGADIFQWFEAQLVIGDHNAPRLNAYGVAFTGAPFINIGFTDDIGWTHTVNTLKNADLYDIALSGPGQYLFDGTPRTLELRQDQILVRQPNGSLTPQSFTIANSVHGPIVAQRADGHVLALRVAGLDGASLTSEYWGMIRARDLDEFNRANATLQMPFFNVIFADRKGETMYLFGGKQPIRNGGVFTDYLGVLNGNVSSTLWTLTLPWRDLPKTINPPSGFVANSNDPPWTSTFPPTISPQDFPAWISPVEMMPRAQNAMTYLLSKARLTAGDVVAGKENVTMLLAGRLLPDLISAAKASGSPLALQAANVLAAWDQTADANSKGGALFQRWYEYYVADPNAGQSPVFGPGYPAFKTEWSPNAPLTTPKGLPNPALAVPALLLAAMEFANNNIPLDAPWGAFHRVILVTHDASFTQTIPLTNAPQSGAPDVFGPVRVIESVFETQPYSRIGASGDGYVQVVDFSPSGPVTAQGLMTYGNSSRPNSPHITDQLAIFETKSLRPILRERNEVVAHAVARESY